VGWGEVGVYFMPTTQISEIFGTDYPGRDRLAGELYSITRGQK